MGRLIEQQAVIDCLTNTAKYYEGEDADEWTKGIHYGLLHGLDNILDNVPTVEAIPKTDYEARLKADLKAILVELQLEIEEYKRDLSNKDITKDHEDFDHNNLIEVISGNIQQKINALRRTDNNE